MVYLPMKLNLSIREELYKRVLFKRNFIQKSINSEFLNCKWEKILVLVEVGGGGFLEDLNSFFYRN